MTRPWKSAFVISAKLVLLVGCCISLRQCVKGLAHVSVPNIDGESGRLHPTKAAIPRQAAWIRLKPDETSPFEVHASVTFFELRGLHPTWTWRACPTRLQASNVGAQP
jgi:hypothetical protein